eukprot:CAMPEP_0180647196 /NCGR_PEP_ID=MMETSP1037_2-20121125/50156_1 /TAXON_ID=632150 /ORGANISM="Azadinium spinosum, Strain 3D9" /LENGTH=119 /DNA_ID=CAMNT_0022671629 /DNA_START=57 /DNA_END=416 /DNA_ORIENTATION=+
MQPLTAILMQSTKFSISSGTSTPAHSRMHTAHWAKQIVHRMQSSQGVFSRSKRVWMRKRLAPRARPGQQQASAQTQVRSWGSPSGPQGNMPPQQTYGSPMTSRIFRRCWAVMQQEQPQP